MHSPGSAVSGYSVLLVVQLAFIVVFGVYTKYGDELLPQDVPQEVVLGDVAENRTDASTDAGE